MKLISRITISEISYTKNEYNSLILRELDKQIGINLKQRSMVLFLPSFNRNKVNKYLTGIIEVKQIFFLNLLKVAVIMTHRKSRKCGRGEDKGKEQIAVSILQN